MRRKEERSKQGQTNKAKQHSTPKAVTFPKKNELPRVRLELYSSYNMYTKSSQLSCLGGLGVKPDQLSCLGGLGVKPDQLSCLGGSGVGRALA